MGGRRKRHKFDEHTGRKAQQAWTNRDWQVEVIGLPEPLEITNARDRGHAKSIAQDYLIRTGRPGLKLGRTDRLPYDPDRHRNRLNSAQKCPRNEFPAPRQGQGLWT